MSGKRQRRLAFADLEAFLVNGQEDADLRQFVSVKTTCRVLPATIAKQTGINRQSVYRWRSDGIPIHTADRIAIRMGVHPLVIWPDFHQEEPCPR